MVVDLDATLVGAHSEKEHATPNFKRGFGFHPMLAFVDHDERGTGEPLAALLRAGNANANNAADQIEVLDAALAQLPARARGRVLVRGDAGSGVKDFLAHVHDLVALAQHAGAVVRLLGDPAQLSAVEAGGALRLLDAEVGAVHLDQLHRFTDPAEASATLALRRGDPTALDYYENHDRIRAGTGEAMLEAAYDAWTTDILTGHTSILIAATAADVTALNARALAERITAGHVQADPDAAVDLRDGNRASSGDWVVTRTNQRSLTWNRGRDWVKNGDLDHHRTPPRRRRDRHRPRSGTPCKLESGCPPTTSPTAWSSATHPPPTGPKAAPSTPPTRWSPRK